MEILYHPRSIKFLQKIPKKEAKKVIGAIGKLTSSSHISNLDIKKLINTKRSYRIRIGNIRVVFEIDEKQKVIYIHEIDFRGNIY